MRLGISSISFAFLSSITFLPAGVFATPVSTVPLGNGQVLDVQGVVGSGASTAYLVVDFSNNSPAGGTYAWEYQYTGTKFESDMMSAVEAAFPSLVAKDPGNSGFIDNFNYGTNIGNAAFDPAHDDSYWASDFGPDLTPADSVNWQFAQLGYTGLQLGFDYANFDGNPADGIGAPVDGQIYGWTINNDNESDNPALPTVAVPEPATLGLASGGILCLLAKRTRRRD